MLLTNVLIAGGTLYAGVNVYREKQKKKKKPWTFYADRLNAKKRRKTNRSMVAEKIKSSTLRSIPLAQPLSSLLASTKGSLQNLGFEQAFSFADVRNQQLKEISSSQDEIEVSSDEKRTNQYFAISLTSLGIATTSALFYPPLGLLSAAALTYVSFPFFQETYSSLVKERKVGIVVLDALLAGICITTGYYVSWSLVCSLIYGGRKILSKTEDHSRRSLLDVFGLQSSSVWVYSNGVEIETPLESLNVDDIVVVHAGETIPVDGTIIKGIATVDQHILTGESQPVEKEVGDQVFASTVLLTGQLFVEVQKAGKETTAAKIADILTQTADFKSSLQSRGEAYSNRSALPTLGLTALALLTVGPVGGITVLNACFAYYMRVLGPIGMLNFLNLASQNGILIKDGRVLDILTQVDTIVFDKTGTLTHAQPHVGQIHTCADYEALEVLKYAAAAEYKQSHPIALAILEEANVRQLVVPQVDETEYKVGYGLTVTLIDKIVRVGSARFMEMEGITIPQHIKETQKASHRQGHSLIMVAINQTLAGAIEMRPTVRPEAREIISQLRSRHVKSMYIISGDHKEPTRKLAEELGIDNYFAETLPEQKAELITQLQEEGKFVCYVGDGINDSIALKKAQVSISLRGASTIATDTAQIILMNETLNQIVQLFDLAQEFDANMKRTLMTSMIPGIITVSGAFFLHFALIHSIILNEIGFATGFLNTMMPLIKHQREKSPQTKPLELTREAKITPSLVAC